MCIYIYGYWYKIKANKTEGKNQNCKSIKLKFKINNNIILKAIDNYEKWNNYIIWVSLEFKYIFWFIHGVSNITKNYKE